MMDLVRGIALLGFACVGLTLVVVDLISMVLG